MLPLYGDSSASLHKNTQSIFWDCVMVCRIGDPLKRLRVDRTTKAVSTNRGRVELETLLAKGLPVTEGDRTNIAHASAIVEAFAMRMRISDAGERRLRDCRFLMANS